MKNNAENNSEAVAAIGRIDVVPTLLAVLCETTGLRFALVARVDGNNWTACAVQDEIHLDVNVGDPLSLRTNIAFESQASLIPIVIEHASDDPRYRDNTDPRLYKLEAFISVPIFLANGRYFGNLCAFDPRVTPVGAPHILPMFKRFAALIVAELENQRLRELEQRALLDERAARESRETLIAVLGHDLRNPLHAAFACNDMLQRKLTDPQLVMLTTTTVRHVS